MDVTGEIRSCWLDIQIHGDSEKWTRI